VDALLETKYGPIKARHQFAMARQFEVLQPWGERYRSSSVNLATAKAFYVDRLGFREIFEASEDGHSGLLGIQRGRCSASARKMRGRAHARSTCSTDSARRSLSWGRSAVQIRRCETAKSALRIKARRRASVIQSGRSGMLLVGLSWFAEYFHVGRIAVFTDCSCKLNHVFPRPRKIFM
jgi:hypothetical protein